MNRTTVTGECYEGIPDSEKVYSISDQTFDDIQKMLQVPELYTTVMNHPFNRLGQSEMQAGFGQKGRNIPIRYEHQSGSDIGRGIARIPKNGLKLQFKSTINYSGDQYVKDGDGSSLQFVRQRDGSIDWNDPRVEISLTNDPVYPNVNNIARGDILVSCSKNMAQKCGVTESRLRDILVACSKNIPFSGRIQKIVEGKTNDPKYIPDQHNRNINNRSFLMSNKGKNNNPDSTTAAGTKDNSHHEGMVDEDGTHPTSTTTTAGGGGSSTSETGNSPPPAAAATTKTSSSSSSPATTALQEAGDSDDIQELKRQLLNQRVLYKQLKDTNQKMQLSEQRMRSAIIEGLLKDQKIVQAIKNKLPKEEDEKGETFELYMDAVAKKTHGIDIDPP